ncbi:MAG: hypothetical protein WAM90_12735 [Rhodanobacter sp.]
MSRIQSLFVIGTSYKTVDLPGRNVCEYTLEWLDSSKYSHGVALWRDAKGLLHLQNIGDFQLPKESP